MASPGQQQGSCGNMTMFDAHDKCAQCRGNRLGHNPCVTNKPCKICEEFTSFQKEMLSTLICIKFTKT